MENIENCWPAFPTSAEFFSDGSMCRPAYEGMTLRQYAAIKLKVPESGNDWLDEMIEKSLRDDFAAKAMQVVILHPQGHGGVWNMAAKCAYEIADEMLEACKGGEA